MKVNMCKPSVQYILVQPKTFYNKKITQTQEKI